MTSRVYGPPALVVKLSNVEVDLLSTFDTVAHSAGAIDDEADNVSTEEVAVLAVQFFADIAPFVLGDIDSLPLIGRIAWNPDSSAFAAD